MEAKKKTRELKPLEDMDVIDNFLFNELMTDEVKGKELCRMILGTVLKREIGKISYDYQKIVQGVSETSHGIIMDTYVTEQVEGHNKNEPDVNVYDIEPDNKDEEKGLLPRRSRYYADLIDTKLLKTGVDYDKLPELVTIFILSYDPFGEGAMYYEAGTTVKTHPQIPYNDGIRRIFLYTNGKLPEGAGDDDKKLMNLLRYIGNSREENVTDDDTRRLNEMVKSTKADKNVGVRYMKSWELEKALREEGREEERANTEAERARADAAEARAENAETRANAAEATLAKYIEKYGDVI